MDASEKAPQVADQVSQAARETADTVEQQVFLFTPLPHFGNASMLTRDSGVTEPGIGSHRCGV